VDSTARGVIYLLGLRTAVDGLTLFDTDSPLVYLTRPRRRSWYPTTPTRSGSTSGRVSKKLIALRISSICSSGISLR